jgi:hypothetical protein
MMCLRYVAELVGAIPFKEAANAFDRISAVRKETLGLLDSLIIDEPDEK